MVQLETMSPESDGDMEMELMLFWGGPRFQNSNATLFESSD